MHLEEELTEVGVGDDGGIVLHQHCLDVAGEMVADVMVGGGGLFAAVVSYQGALHAFHAAEVVLHSPETSAGKDGDAGVWLGLIELDDRTALDGRLDLLECRSVLLLQVGVRLATGVVVAQVVVLDLQGDGIA